MKLIKLVWFFVNWYKQNVSILKLFYKKWTKQFKELFFWNRIFRFNSFKTIYDLCPTTLPIKLFFYSKYMEYFCSHSSTKLICSDNSVSTSYEHLHIKEPIDTIDG